MDMGSFSLSLYHFQNKCIDCISVKRCSAPEGTQIIFSHSAQGADNLGFTHARTETSIKRICGQNGGKAG